jgi:hypothetical protein
MKIAMIHDNRKKGVDVSAKVTVAAKIKKYHPTTTIHIKTEHIDSLEAVFEKAPVLVIFMNIRFESIRAAKQRLPAFDYPVYYVRIGNEIQSDAVNESVLSIEKWDPRPFLAFISSVIHS